MPSIQVFHWSLWGLSLLAGVGAILALYKLDFLQRYIPTKEEADRLTRSFPSFKKKNAAVARPSKCCRKKSHDLNLKSGIYEFSRSGKRTIPMPRRASSR